MKIIREHIAPLLLAVIAVWAIAYWNPYESQKNKKHIDVNYTPLSKYYFDNFDTIPEGISPFSFALKDKKQIVLMGSSELTSSSAYIPYQFFNDSTIFPLIAFGHAFYQSFSMYCNLLAFKEYIEGKKICIILSPGWFETQGTNTQAFLEFVRPEMLGNIIHQSSYSVAETKPIGDYIINNNALFAGLSAPMEYLSKQHGDFIPFKSSILEHLKESIAHYHFDNKNPSIQSPHITLSEPDWEKNRMRCKASFQQTCTNQLGIKDEILKSLLNGEKDLKKKTFSPTLPLSQNQEFQDLKLLIGLLKKYKAKPIFVMQGLNPAGYNELNRFDEIEQAISKILAEEKIPYLNLFTSQAEQYQVGILNDLMHMGDLGWNEVNRFIYQEFCHE